jgi:two-component system sensor histidine kinase KdpD
MGSEAGAERGGARGAADWRGALRPTSSWRAYAAAPLSVALCTLIAAAADRLRVGEANVIMLFLLGVLAVARQGGRGPSALAAVLSVLSFNFFFVHPRLTLAIGEARYLITFTVMLLVGLVVSNFTIRLRQQAAAAGERERRTAALYALSRELASTRGLDSLLLVAARHVATVFGCRALILLPQPDGRLLPWGGEAGPELATPPVAAFAPDAAELAAARQAFERRSPAGRSTPVAPDAAALYLPLLGSQAIVGVLGVRLADRGRPLSPDQQRLLDTFASQTALAVERATLARAAAQAMVAAETERLRAALLSSVSHDLRTPLAIIAGALDNLAQHGDSLDPQARRELAQAAAVETHRLNRLLGNLLEMTRLEGGAVRVRKEWQPLEEVVGVAVARAAGDEGAGGLPGDHPLSIELPPDLPLIPLDGALIEQVLVNLLENAAGHTLPGTPIVLRARQTPGAVEVEVADRGPGLAPGEELRVFEKFYRGGAEGGRGNVGLGLAICKGMVEAHGGRIWAENRPGGGAAFRFTLPLEGDPPVLPAEGA